MWGWEGLYGRPLPGATPMTHGQTGVGERATIKALPSTPNHPRPYGVTNTISLG
jgi:hypothetical protein